MAHIVPTRVLAIAAASLLALTSDASAQATERVLYVSARDAQTKAPLDSLSPADIRVTEDDRAREVLRVAPATSPMPIALVLDNQAAAQTTITDVRRAVTAFVSQAASLGPIAIITTADRPTIVQDYTTDVDKLTAAANRLFAQPDSGATLLDAIVEVSRGLGRREEDRAAIVVMTTELTEFSTLNYTQVLDGLKGGGAMMSAVVLQNVAGSINNEPSRNRAIVLDRGVTQSGGTRVDVLTSMSYGEALGQIAAALKSQHRVVYARPQQLIPPERIEVRGTRPELQIVAAPARGQKER